MSEEIPVANPPLTAEEQSAADKLSGPELLAVDKMILSNCSDRWLKVARVVTRSEDSLKNQHPALSFVFYTQRLRLLVDDWRLESRGDLSFIRFSEVRLPSQAGAIQERTTDER